MMELLPEETTLRLLGSRFHGVEPLITYLYSWPTCAPGTSRDQTPVLPQATSRVAVDDQPLKSPATRTLEAFGAQTRKVTTPLYGVEPQPGRADCACDGLGLTSAAKNKRHAINDRETLALWLFLVIGGYGKTC